MYVYRYILGFSVGREKCKLEMKRRHGRVKSARSKRRRKKALVIEEEEREREKKTYNKSSPARGFDSFFFLPFFAFGDAAEKRKKVPLLIPLTTACRQGWKKSPQVAPNNANIPLLHSK